jgi:hypothetical protein
MHFFQFITLYDGVRYIYCTSSSKYSRSWTATPCSVPGSNLLLCEVLALVGPRTHQEYIQGIDDVHPCLVHAVPAIKGVNNVV